MEKLIISFAGHRDLIITQKIRQKLRKQLIDIISHNDCEYIFYCGALGTFDGLCAETLKDLKKYYENYKVIVVTPYFKENYIKELSYLVNSGYYDEILYPPIEHVPPKYAIEKRNQYIIDHSDILISYVERSYGGAYKTLKYAKKRKLPMCAIFNLAPT